MNLFSISLNALPSAGFNEENMLYPIIPDFCIKLWTLGSLSLKSISFLIRAFVYSSESVESSDNLFSDCWLRSFFNPRMTLSDTLMLDDYDIFFSESFSFLIISYFYKFSVKTILLGVLFSSNNFSVVLLFFLIFLSMICFIIIV